MTAPAPPAAAATAGPVDVWDLPLVPWTRAEASAAVAALVDAGRPSYFITANLHYAMLTAHDPRLAAVNAGAAFVLADGAPLVWASRWKKTPVPERVAGSDLIFDLCEQAAARGHRLFFLGGAEGVAVAASEKLAGLYPGLRVVGTACPAPGELADPDHHRRLVERVRDARPDVLLVAFGQPKGELWIARHLAELGVPVCAQVGATLDFIAGRARRAPVWLQRAGLEWAYRMSREPARLFPRYAANARFLASAVARDLAGGRARGRSPVTPPAGR